MTVEQIKRALSKYKDEVDVVVYDPSDSTKKFIKAIDPLATKDKDGNDKNLLAIYL